MKPPSRRCRRDKGFTLIELITVMIIIGIMAFVVLPRFDLLRGFNEVGYRDQVKAALEYARKSAVALRRQVQVTIAGNNVTLQFQRQTPEGEGAAALQALNLPGNTNNQIIAPAGVTLLPATTFTFDALGRPSFAATLVLTVSGAGNITVEAETGYVH